MIKKWVQLSGGIGNQLFQLAYAYYLQGLDNQVGIYSNPSKSQVRHRGSNLAEEFSTQELGVTVANGLEALALKLSAAAFSRLGKPHGASRVVLDAGMPGEVLHAHKSAWILRGYFQDPDLAWSQASRILATLTRRYPSTLEPHNEGIALHYRRGDYVAHANTLGLLSDGFFIEACLRAVSHGARREVVIFSNGDASNLASKLMRAGFSLKSLPTKRPRSALEELLELSQSSRFMVLSNSSYSWWAAALSNQTKVIYPENWFRDGSLSDMGLKGWLSQNSEWVTP